MSDAGQDPERLGDERHDDLRRRVEKLAKINSALMHRVERSMDYQANAFSMFQTAIGLEGQVRVRTEELKSAMHRLERMNSELVDARDAAERANRFKTHFFTSVGHDLLQPLHAARLSLSALIEDGADVSRTQSARLIEQVDHALTTIEELLRTILDLSKLEAGAMTPSLSTISLGDLFRSLAFDLAPIVRSRGLILTVRATDALVSSDPLMLRRILQNLLANAVRYTESGRILLAARRRGRDLRLEVWDTGPGISPSETEQIFEEFQRGSASRRAQGGGFGVGLSIMRRMSDALGHRVELCSRLGQGTRFSVTVPHAGIEAPPPKSSVPSAGWQAYGFAGARAVVIDNDAAVLEGMRPLLEGWGCDVRYALNLAAIDALISDEPKFCPDVILADYHLDHGECGLSAVQSLRSLWSREIPAVLITADHGTDVDGLAKEAACELLRKPVKPAELRALISHLLE